MSNSNYLRVISEEINEQFDSENFISLYDVYKKLGITTPDEWLGEDKELAELFYADKIQELKDTGWCKGITGLVRRSRVIPLMDDKTYKEYYEYYPIQ